MEKINELKDKTKEEIGVFLEQNLKDLGQTKFDIKISPQAKEIISNYGDKFPLEHFKDWFLKKHQFVHGGHLHEYLTVEDGFVKGIKEV